VLLEGRLAPSTAVSAAGVVRRPAASSEESRLLEAFAVAIDGGPCVDCVHTGTQVLCDDLTTPEAQRRWARYARGAAEAGFRATHALPMRLRDQVIGVLTLLHTARTP
jgi:GAF domain-containing protein